MLSDAHIHLSPFAEKFLDHNDVLTIVSCATPEECAAAEAYVQRHPHVTASYGIHPWHVDTTDPAAMQPWLEKARIIGEIGMDNVWCHTDLALQRKRFEEQLAYASSAHKPVVLHTKGMEGEILNLIRHYPNTYHVHWYAAADHLDDYLALGCYMSVGPFPSLDKHVAAVATRTPLERLLIETDGIDAVRWATGQPQSTIDYPAALRQIAAEIANLRGLTTESVLQQTHDNLLRFVQGA
ncbi:MAG: TatD family hydrolase [Peptococcaceae bacterium]|nr:TatD family hydrolase [Peptococcaceae bacterium]